MHSWKSLSPEGQPQPTSSRQEQPWENLSFAQIINSEDKIKYILSAHPFPASKKYFCESYTVIGQLVPDHDQSGQIIWQMFSSKKVFRNHWNMKIDLNFELKGKHTSEILDYPSFFFF